MSKIMADIEQAQLKTDLPEIRIGDTVRVRNRIIEGDKERIQAFEGTVIARKGAGVSETISLHRVSFGEGMERVFLIHSPRIVSIEVVRSAKVRRSKLYYLRGKSGKKARLQAKVVGAVAAAVDADTETPVNA